MSDQMLGGQSHMPPHSVAVAENGIKRLQALLASGAYEDDRGHQPIVGNILTDEVDFLYKTIVANGFQNCLDIGVAKGVSFAAIAAGIKQNGGGTLYGIDPDQGSDHSHSASRLCRLLDLPFTEIIEDQALYATAAIRSKVEALDFVFIDGWHTFDTTLVDFLLADDLVRPGGIVGFHDCYYPSKLKVIRFALSHRDYELLADVARPRFGMLLRIARALRNAGRHKWNALSLMYWRFNLKTDSSIILIRKRSDHKPPHFFFRPF